MRFLADENLDFAVVRSLRAAGHDVRALAEETNRTIDADVIALAASEARILLTEDKDFGWYAFVAGAGGWRVNSRSPAIATDSPEAIGFAEGEATASSPAAAPSSRA